MLRFAVLALPLAAAVAAAAPAAAPAVSVWPVNHTTVARATPAGAAVLRPDQGPHRRVAAPAGCGFGAAGSGRLLWHCHDQLLVTDLHGADAHAVMDPAATPGAEDDFSIYDIEAVGSDWIAGTFAGDHGPNSEDYINWHTGAERTTYDDLSPTAYPDVDAPGLFAPLCAGARRKAGRSSYDEAWGPTRAAGHWVLTAADNTDTADPMVFLHRCGVRGSLVFHHAFAAALSASWLAWADQRDDTVHVRHLREGRGFRFRARALADDDVPVLTDRYVSFGAHRHRLRLPGT